MRLKAYQAVIAAGVLATIVNQVLRHGASLGPNRSLDEGLEGISFILCFIGGALGFLPLRRRYSAAGYDQKVARRDPLYVQDRRAFRLAMVFVVGALSSNLASSFGVDAGVGAAAGVFVFSVLVLIIDRLRA